MIEPSQISNEIQAWTEIFERKNNDRIEKMRKEMDNKFETILREFRTNKNASKVTNLRSGVDDPNHRDPKQSL